MSKIANEIHWSYMYFLNLSGNVRIKNSLFIGRHKYKGDKHQYKERHKLNILNAGGQFIYKYAVNRDK